jgi:hypothetical protein
MTAYYLGDWVWKEICASRPDVLSELKLTAFAEDSLKRFSSGWF